MGNYLEQISVTGMRLKGKDFPEMMDAARKEAGKCRWRDNGTARDVLKAESFTQACRAMGISLDYAGDDMFSVDVDGAYASAFLVPFAECVGGHVGDGEIAVRVGGRIVRAVFKKGTVSVAEESVGGREGGQ